MEPRSIPDAALPLDLQHRDPKDMNSHVRVLFEDVFAEPEGSHSIPGVWRCSFRTYNGAKWFCYLLLSVLCAVPLSCCWGCDFACAQFYHVWNVAPCLRMCRMNMLCLQMFWSTIVRCVCEPLCETCALCFSHIKIKGKA
ncbi:caveolin-3-like [Lethenteron reissneri]|uniref:caveolin-3-like n=1 Tax=Lethenteron reissneri TaxID=7753 RepID=UPI002AB6EF1A|nr:caveolin-3-like [Lethenteron reissneri]